MLKIFIKSVAILTTSMYNKATVGESGAKCIYVPLNESEVFPSEGRISAYH